MSIIPAKDVAATIMAVMDKVLLEYPAEERGELKAVMLGSLGMALFNGPVQSNCKHEWADDTKDKPAWRCVKCGSDYTK